MRRIDRGPAPALVQSPEFQRLWGDYLSFRASGGSRVTQTKLGPTDFVGMLDRLAGEYVRSLFQNRCAYTERADKVVLHLHRPESDAFDDRLGVSADHYWWTAGWYRNWYAASYELVGLKRTTFPVLGDRALVPSPHEVGPGWEPAQPYLDNGLLLDPCEDHPEWHLRFHRDGTVTPWADEGPAVADRRRAAPRGRDDPPPGPGRRRPGQVQGGGHRRGGRARKLRGRTAGVDAARRRRPPGARSAPAGPRPGSRAGERAPPRDRAAGDQRPVPVSRRPRPAGAAVRRRDLPGAGR